MNNKKTMKYATTWLPLAFGIALVCGCQGSKPTAPVVENGAVADTKLETVGEMTSPREREESERLLTCQKELNALKDINPGQHKNLLLAFDQLMKGASQYARLRPEVNAETQETMDALYRYKAKRLCTNIAQATLNGLADRGEKQK